MFKMDSFWNIMLTTLVALIMCVPPLMPLPVGTSTHHGYGEYYEDGFEAGAEETVFDLIENKDVDFVDQASTIVDLALLMDDLGYMNLDPMFTTDDLNKTEMNIQIAKLQENAGIKVTGTITGSTIVAAKSPRCGLKDFVPSYNQTTRNKRYVTAGSRIKWNKNRITWRIGSWPTSGKILSKQVEKDIRAAFKSWSDVIPLEFVEINSDDTNQDDVDIRIEFQKKKHNRDPRAPSFDGRGGTLAHAFYPNGGWGHIDGDVHFDDDEVFTFKDKEFGTNLFYTAAHEIGHSLGLQHSSNPEALMNAWDKGYIKDFKLSKDDVLGIQSIYGINPNLRPDEGPMAESTTPKPDVTTETVASHGDCENAKIAVAVIEGSLFVFQGEHLWRYQGMHTNQRLLTPLHGFPIRRFFKNGPKSIDAVFTYKNGSAALIRGKNLWVFDIRTRRMVGQPGTYPMRISKAFGIPRDIDAAFHDSIDGVAYFFKDDQLWKYDTENNRLLTRDSIPARDEFKNVPVPIGGAYSDDHGHRYLIKDQRYWQYDTGSRTVAPGYPRLFAFLDCH